ncbi:MAG: cysteine hydrolase [Chlamydiia bacterium]|nr:cysteine hydrolase [Chlamydiia bacterium]
MGTAIITLDIINEICHPNGKLARYPERIANKQIIDKINTLTAWGREEGHLIIHIRVGFHPHYRDGSTRAAQVKKAKENQVLLLTKWGGQFCEELDLQKGDAQVIKHRVSAFYGTDLELILRANDIDTVILTGVSTNNAVELTAREAHDRDFEVIIIEDATECASDEEQAASIKALSRLATWKQTEDFAQ